MYVKLFASLYQGTLRGHPDEILVFTNLLAHADQQGIVDKHWRAIADETGLPRERVEAAIKNLEMPDTESRSPENEGRRIIPLDGHRQWGWSIVNYGKYRAIRNEDDRREQNRKAQEKWRSKHLVSKVSRDKPPSSQAEAEEEEEAIQQISAVPASPETATQISATPDGLDPVVWQEWVDYRVKIRKPLKPASIQAAQEALAAFGCDQAAVVKQSIANGYQGLFALKNGGTNGQTKNDTRSRAQRVSDKLDEIARASIERENSIAGTLGGSDSQTFTGEVLAEVDLGN